MIVRRDLKNTARYKELVEEHRESILKQANRTLYTAIGITIVYGILIYFDRDMLFDLSIFYINFMIYLIFAASIYRWNFQVYEICVRKKWVVDGDDKWLYRISDGIQVDNSNLYQVLTKKVYNKIQEGETYLFLARKNVLYDIL